MKRLCSILTACLLASALLLFPLTPQAHHSNPAPTDSETDWQYEEYTEGVMLATTPNQPDED